jgi:putative flippase GtrA
MKTFCQAIRHLLIGGFATLIDLAIFKILFCFNPLTSKSISFLVATAIKYWGNKHWAFKKPEKDGIIKEIIFFLVVTIVGLAIDIAAFTFFSFYIWESASVILAAIIAAGWNFTAYKFLVFKK